LSNNDVKGVKQLNTISTKDIAALVNKINQENEPALEEYITKFFSEYIDISFFDELTFTGHEHRKVENAITHLVQLNTYVSVSTTLKVLEKAGLFEQVNE